MNSQIVENVAEPTTGSDTLRRYYRAVKAAPDGWAEPVIVGKKLMVPASSHRKTGDGLRVTARWAASNWRPIPVLVSSRSPGGQLVVMTLDNREHRKWVLGFPIEEGLAVQIERVTGRKREELWEKMYDATAGTFVGTDINTLGWACETCGHGLDDHPTHRGRPGLCLADGCNCDAYVAVADGEGW